MLPELPTHVPHCDEYIVRQALLPTPLSLACPLLLLLLLCGALPFALCRWLLLAQSRRCCHCWGILILRFLFFQRSCAFAYRLPLIVHLHDRQVVASQRCEATLRIRVTVAVVVIAARGPFSGQERALSSESSADCQHGIHALKECSQDQHFSQASVEWQRGQMIPKCRKAHFG